jgi:hypothetical protein
MFEDDPLDSLDDDYLEPDSRAPRLSDGEISHHELELDKMPRELWELALARIPPKWRTHVAYRLPEGQLRNLAFHVIYELDNAEARRSRARDVARHRALRTAAPLPTPAAGHTAAKSTVQVNVRLRRDDYARLQQAAKAVGLRATTLARALILNGARKVLDENERGAT